VTTILITLFSMLLHEAGHVAAALFFGITVRRMGWSRKGMYIVRESGPPVANLMVTLAGPFANLLMACAWPVSRPFAVINLIFGLTNLLPITGSDGARAILLLTGLRRQAGFANTQQSV